MKRPVALFGVFAATFALAACGGGATQTGVSGPPQPGGTLRYGLSQAPTCSDPAQSSTDQTIYVTRQIADSLTDRDTETGEIRLWPAERWAVRPDVRTCTFHLRTASWPRSGA